MKTCTECLTAFDDITTNFYKNFTRKDGSISYKNKCKACHSKLSVQWRKDNPDKAKAIGRKCDSKRDHSERAKAWRAGKEEHRKAYRQAYNATHAEAIKEYSKRYYQENREVKISYNKSYYVKNKLATRQKARECYLNGGNLYWQQYYQLNKHRYVSRKAQRRGKELLATPSWCDVEACKAFYKHASDLKQQTGEIYHVDHIDPLVHPLVCGLHVPANLRVITGTENYRKNNTFKPYGFDGHYYEI